MWYPVAPSSLKGRYERISLPKKPELPWILKKLLFVSLCRSDSISAVIRAVFELCLFVPKNIYIHICMYIFKKYIMNHHIYLNSLSQWRMYGGDRPSDRPYTNRKRASEKWNKEWGGIIEFYCFFFQHKYVHILVVDSWLAYLPLFVRSKKNGVLDLFVVKHSTHSVNENIQNIP